MSALTTREVVFGVSMPIVAVIVVICIGLILAGCPASKATCQIIHAADEVCTVIEYVGADGGKQQVSVSKQELQEMAVGVAVRHAQDAGTDAPAK